MPSFSAEAQEEASLGVADVTGVAQLPEPVEGVEFNAGELSEAPGFAVVAQLPVSCLASDLAPVPQQPVSAVFSATVFVMVEGPVGETSGVPGFSAGSLTVTGEGFISVVMMEAP